MCCRLCFLLLCEESRGDDFAGAERGPFPRVRSFHTILAENQFLRLERFNTALRILKRQKNELTRTRT